MPKICVDAGHNNSGADTGAQGNGLFEQHLNLDIALRLQTLLKVNGFQVVMTREGDFVQGDHSSINASLQTRCAIANREKADLFVAIHCNAGGGTGVEVFAVPGGRAEKCAGRVLDRLIEICKFTNRGVKTDRNFYVLVNTVMPAILTENGFIDNKNDAEKLKDPEFRQKIAIAHAKGICDYFGQMYVESTKDVLNVKPKNIPILGKETITLDQCQAYIGKRNPDAPNLLSYYIKYGDMLGIKWGYAVAQMLHETGFLKFGGDVLPGQNNFAGIGATGGGAVGASFTTPDEGVLAHLEHLYAYASAKPLPAGLPKVDPRFDLVSRGSYPNWQDLDGHWAVPGNGYGDAIVRIYDEMMREQAGEHQATESRAIDLLRRILEMLLEFFKGSKNG